MTEFTPALGYRWLTPFYDIALSFMTREKQWRHRLLRQVQPGPTSCIFDVGCGTGSFAILCKKSQPAARVIGIDPDAEVLTLARKKASDAQADVEFIEGFLSQELLSNLPLPTHIVSSLVFHQVPIEEKRRLLEVMHKALGSRGVLHVADYGQQRTLAMRAAFRSTVQLLDGLKDTQPNADGALPIIMKEVGFSRVEELDVVPTITGSISLYRARS